MHSQGELLARLHRHCQDDLAAEKFLRTTVHSSEVHTEAPTLVNRLLYNNHSAVQHTPRITT
jgi:hypothetical protein